VSVSIFMSVVVSTSFIFNLFFMYLFIYLFIYSFVRSFVRSFIHSVSQSVIHSFIHSFIHSGRGFETHQTPPLFPWARNVLPLLLISTGWFQERIRAWFHNRTKINWGPYGRLT